MSTTTATPTTYAGGGLRGAIGSEWTKIWSLRSTWWYLAGTVALTALIALQLGFSAEYDNTHLEPGEPTRMTMASDVAVSTVLVVQVVVVALAMLAITAEYATGSIRSTLQWTPVRRNVLLAKVAVVAPVTFGLGLLVGAVGTAAAIPTLGRWGYVDAGGLVVDLLAIATYLCLASVFTLGTGAVIRSSVGTLTTAFLLLLMLPMMLGESSFRIAVWVGAVLPGGAGNSFLTGVTDPIGPAASLVVVTAWAVLGTTAGIRTLNHRDA